jgi:hypothetical protein
MDLTCTTCRSPKAPFQCGLCNGQVCKKCLETLTKDAFAFDSSVQKELGRKHYCPGCFGQRVLPELTRYEELIEKASQVIVFMKNRSEECRLMSRSEKPLKVIDCADKEETLMRLAFEAVKRGAHVLIDVEVTSKKVRMNAYQTTLWSGTAIPTNVDAKTLDRIDKNHFFKSSCNR